jgi:hypothetical protein
MYQIITLHVYMKIQYNKIENLISPMRVKSI